MTYPVDVSIQRIRINFASYVSRSLTADDLLILTAKINADFLGLPTLGGPEAIAHQNPNLSLIVVHIPST